MVQTNVITGFLGVGKTSAIRHLLSLKPAGERWAVLINEFGKIGIDKQLLDSVCTDKQQVIIREVPGGCMCCAAGLPMQVALNQLLRLQRPDRLLIEPSGLGHPEEVIASLSGPNYRQLLDVRSTLTLVDPRHFHDNRYTEHPVFLQQLNIADAIVANKEDLCQPADLQQLQKLLATQDLDDLPLYQAEQGQLNPAWLTPPAKFNQAHWHTPPETLRLTETTKALSSTGYLHELQEQDGWFSCGWRLRGDWQFDKTQFMAWCDRLKVRRLKAVVNTVHGALLVNQVDDALTHECTAQQASESRIELISDTRLHTLNMEQKLLACLTRNR
ncbi:MAG: CobW family GTP-binding protein [Methylophaga sp.]